MCGHEKQIRVARTAVPGTGSPGLSSRSARLKLHDQSVSSRPVNCALGFAKKRPGEGFMNNRLRPSWRHPFAALAFGLLMISASDPAAAQARATMKQHRIADGVYMMENSSGSGNSTFLITDEGVVVFDADVRTADQVLAAIRKLTDKKIRYLITSHAAGDHATGAWHFREDRPVYIAT
ncbi:MAG TPA: MBL fold metallo-hydrolase, partial [Beijerinckiaceae bacterium]|nr:MBL fold metallo-hydrolase [Beijerinckiaceae bacterium]